MAQISKAVSPSTSFKNDSSMVSHHHGNLWGDGLIQSLSSPYGAPAYREHAERLIEELKHSLSCYMEEYHCNDDLIKRLQMVDTFECLGIDRHFQREIKVALDYIHRCWNERGIGVGSKDSFGKDLNATALGFRTLRLHQYNVSSGALENFKDENGEFFCTSSGEHEEDDKRVRSMLSLFRASNISFPGEKVMDEAKAFTTNFLMQVLGRDEFHIDQSLLRKVKYALEFPWHCSLPRLETRSFIEIYGQDSSWLKSNINRNILELAKLDFNILQNTHQTEIQLISRWLRDSGIVQLNCYRKRHVELHFMVVIGTFEPEFSLSRIAFTKLCTVMTIIDDLYDTHGTLDELKIFTEAVRRWDLSLIDDLPDYMKIALEIFLKTSNELIAEVLKEQGRDMATFIRKNAWEPFVQSNLQEARWISTRHTPTFNEYINNATTSSGLCILNLIPHLLMGQLLPDNILEQLYSPSKLHHLVELTMRLTDDIRDFKAEKEGGDVASVIECYLKDHPESTAKNALNHFSGILDISLKELNLEFMKQDSVPLCCKKYIFNFIRAVQLLTKYRDGFNTADKETKDQIFKALIEPVQLGDCDLPII